jgi:hypothetical protein
MTPMISNKATPVPPPAYYRAQARLRPALHIDALTLVNTLHLLTLCRLAVRLAHRRCSPLTCWSRGSASNLQRRVPAAHRTLAHAVATVLSGYARLVT